MLLQVPIALQVTQKTSTGHNGTRPSRKEDTQRRISGGERRSLEGTKMGRKTRASRKEDMHNNGYQAGRDGH